MNWTVETAIRLRAYGYRPDAPLLMEDGRTVEAVSYPFPAGGAFWIMVRETPGDPATLVTARIPDEALDLLPAIGE